MKLNDLNPDTSELETLEDIDAYIDSIFDCDDVGIDEKGAFVAGYCAGISTGCVMAKDSLGSARELVTPMAMQMMASLERLLSKLVGSIV